MLSFASKASSVMGSLNGFGPLGKTVGKLLTTDVYERVPTKELNLVPTTVDDIYKHDHSVQDFGGYLDWRKKTREDVKDKKYYYEDPSAFDIYALRGMNTYRWRYKKNIRTLFEAYKVGKEPDEINISMMSSDVAPSLFNPSYGVQTLGITQRVPLLNEQDPVTNDVYTADCSIRRLVSDSLKMNSPLGMAQYRLVDFMFCKDLGKVPNNRLITLRKFAFPIGDHIFRGSSAKYSMGGKNSFETPGDIGRLISWFDTDDNKLEEITKYDVAMSWKEIKSKIQEIDSKEDSQDRGPLGMLINTVTPGVNNFQNKMGGVQNHLLGILGSKINAPFGLVNLGPKQRNDWETLYMRADNNRVYTPKNTVQDTHLYEGVLTLKQEITLNFSYKLRAYDNINPKSAMLDLMGNILTVTYKRGSYWAGERRMIGPPQNKAAWRKANNFIEGAWNKMGGIMGAIAGGTLDIQSIMGNISNAVGFLKTSLVEGTKTLYTGMKNIVAGGSEGLKATANNVLQKGAQAAQQINKSTGLSKYLKGMLKDNLGRPALYAMDSLISGDDCGFWHLTIGNPYNPIMVIGNLIMTNASIQQFGPLGIDDFPSEIKVTCTVKPGRSRDMSEISRYYTQGLNNIYISKIKQKSTDFHNWGAMEFDEVEYHNKLQKMKEKNMASEEENPLENVTENIEINSSETQGNILKQNINNTYSDGYGENAQYANIDINSEVAGRIAATNNYSQKKYVMSHDQEDVA